MATSCPAGFIPDADTGLCKPSSSKSSSNPLMDVAGMGMGSGGGGIEGVAALPKLPGIGGAGVASPGAARTSTPFGIPPGGIGAPRSSSELWPESNYISTPDPGDDGTVHGGPAQPPVEGNLGSGPCPQGSAAEPGSGACFCGDGECRDVVSGQCRQYNPNREKVNETDDITRPTGGGRGYCRQLDPGMQGQGGGGGGAGSSSMGFDDIWGQIQGLLNSPSRYTPELMAQLQGQAKNRQAGETQVATEAATADQVRRGIFSSPLGAALTQKAREPAAANFDKAVTDIGLAKVNADAQDKMFAVQATMQWVQMLMQNRQFDANLKLAYARLLQEWKVLQAQLSDPNRLLGGIFS